MSYLRTPDESDPTDPAAALFDADRAAQGFVANHTRVFALTPAIHSAWQQLSAAVKDGMDLRRYELVTLAAARALRSSYCSLAHGKVLRDRFYDPDTLNAIATDHHTANLDPVDIAITDFAERVATNPTTITESDIDSLRHHNLTEKEIFQIILTVSARCFFSTALDAAGAQPDPHYRTTLEPQLQKPSP